MYMEQPALNNSNLLLIATMKEKMHVCPELFPIYTILMFTVWILDDPVQCHLCWASTGSKGYSKFVASIQSVHKTKVLVQNSILVEVAQNHDLKS